MTKEEARAYIEEWLKDECLDSKDKEALTVAVKELKQEPKTEWISVSERLPEERKYVLVTVEQNDHRYTEIMCRDKDINAWTDDSDDYTDEITAWMPLPEPYKTEVRKYKKIKKFKKVLDKK